MKKLNYLMTVALLAIGSTAFAQDDADADHTVTISAQETAILDLETSNTLNFNLQLTTPNEAGTTVGTATNTDTWINYTSVVGSGLTRSVTVESDVAIPTGYLLTVVAGGDAGGGNGTAGTATAAVTPNNTTAQNVITGIGSAYTGDGATNGHQLTYTLAPDNANFSSILHSVNTAITLTYTITDDI